VVPLCESCDVHNLVHRVCACRICAIQPSGSPLPHPPRPVLRVSSTARIAVCGQAPGLRVHQSGVPFSDASGVRLREWMGVTSDAFYDEAKVAVVPMGFCFPGYDKNGSDLPPRRECAPRWRVEVFAHLPRVELILAIGGHAIKWHVPSHKNVPVRTAVADWREILHRPDIHPAVLPLPHPSWRNTGWLASNPWFATEILPVLRARVAALLR
jgi:uracil-DNA glycosylase